MHSTPDRHAALAPPAVGPTAVFDIGGTWFRRAVRTPDGRLVDACRRPAVNYLNAPNASPADLVRALVDYVVGEVDAAAAAHPGLDAAGISLGAALNAHTGEVLQASPLWGPATGPFPVLELLRAARPAVRWALVNDVTAALWRHVWEDRAELAAAGCPRVALFTISTGIAARTYDLTTGTVPTDRAHGVQGEVGHWAIDLRFRGDSVPAVCDCGGAGHLNAYSSGRGIPGLARAVAARHPAAFAASALWRAAGGDPARIGFPEVADAVDAGDPLATEILDAACRPVADAIALLLTFDPAVERVYMVGGVVGRLGERYMDRLHAALDALGMYQVTSRDPGYFRARVVRGRCDDASGMIGAGLCADAARQDGRPPAGCQSAGCPERSSRTVRAARVTSYAVDFVPRLLDPDNPALRDAAGASPGQRRLVVCDAGAAGHYGDAVAAYFDRHGIATRLLTLETSEAGKTMDGVTRLVKEFADYGLLRRSEPVLAVGGGILTDMVGFAAGIYRRGTPYVRVPTTLMGMVDAAIGVKTGVSCGGKNRVGAFHPPARTAIDPAFLRTLAPRHLRCGLAEIVKIALVADADLFARLEADAAALVAGRFQSPDGDAVIRRAVHLMLDELEPNLFEDDLRRRVDFGHSFSPGIEVASGYTVLHGEAVSIDMAVSAALSVARGLLSDEDFGRVVRVLAGSGLPTAHPLAGPAVMADALRSTREHRDGRQRFPLLAGIGRVEFVDDVSPAEVVDAVAFLADRVADGVPAADRSAEGVT